VAAIVLCAIVAGQGHGVTGYSPRTYLYFALLAIVPQLIGHGTLNWALKYLSATTVSVFILGEPIGSAILAFFVFGEGVQREQAIGGTLILAGIVVAGLGAGRSKKDIPNAQSPTPKPERPGPQSPSD